MKESLGTIRQDRDLLWFAARYIAEAAHDPEGRQATGHDPELFASRFVGVVDFVEGALKNQAIHIMKSVGRRGLPKFDLTKFAQQHVRALPYYIGVINRLPLEYDYTEHINVFRSCWQLIDFPHDYESLCLCRDALLALGPTSPDAELYADLFNRLVDQIRAQAKVTRLSTILAERRRQANVRYRVCSNYADSLHEAFANLVVIRLDLYYLKEYAHLVDFNRAKRDIDHFFANRRNNRLFKALVGYIAKLEYGIDKQLHFHVLLFFDGAKRDPRKHIHLAKSMGEYWCKVITKGQGDYWNCNAKIHEFLKKGICGIGPIHASDTDLRKNLKEHVIFYLCKVEQFVRPKLSRKAKLLTKGNRPPPARRRRPRREIHYLTGDQVEA